MNKRNIGKFFMLIRYSHWA
jgi:hypothetical protein